MGVYKLTNRCPYCHGKRSIYEEWVDGVLEVYYVGCDNEECRGYHIDYPYAAATVRLDILVARHGGLRMDGKTRSALTDLSKGVHGNWKAPNGKHAQCGLCHRPIETPHADNCPVQVAIDILGEFHAQPSA